MTTFFWSLLSLVDVKTYFLINTIFQISVLSLLLLATDWAGTTLHGLCSPKYITTMIVSFSQLLQNHISPPE